MERWRNLLRVEDEIVGIGIDRLDYTKGIPERLRAIDRFLEKHPSFIESAYSLFRSAFQPKPMFPSIRPGR